MDTPVLTDPKQFPTDSVIATHLGKKIELWSAVFDCLARDYPEINKEWRYYNDGKSWLMKVTKKTKTIFWLSVVKGGFRTGFYFTDKAARAIAASALSPELKKEFREGTSTGKLRAVRIMFRRKRDIADLKTLIDIKLSMK